MEKDKTNSENKVALYERLKMVLVTLYILDLFATV